MRQGFGVKANPTIGTDNPVYGKAPRDRVLTDEEIRVIWRNCLDDDFGKIVRLLMLTACRRDEIGGLRWAEIDLAGSKMALPKERTKSKRPHNLTLPTTAVAILDTVRRRNSCQTLFGGGASGFNAWSYNTWRSVRASLLRKERGWRRGVCMICAGLSDPSRQTWRAPARRRARPKPLRPQVGIGASTITTIISRRSLRLCGSGKRTCSR